MRCSPADLADVDRILKDDSVFPYITDDGGMGPEEMRSYAYQLLDNVKFYILKPRANTIVIFIPSNCITYDVHVAAIQGGGRKHAVKDATAAVMWMLENTEAQKFTTLAPRCNRRAGIFARMCGMVREGTITKAYQKDGKIYDIDIFGADKDYILSKQQEEVTCQEQ